MSNQHSKNALTQARVQEIISYDAETGVFTWLSSRGGKAWVGTRAGNVNKRGYVEICVGRTKWLGHRLAWFYTHGVVPKVIDHINGNCSDNRLVNLRPATQTLNLANAKRRSNNTSGYKGVTFCKDTNRWLAQVRKHGRNVKIGRFDTPELAHAAYVAAAERFFGEFARAG